jgi:hypothetical protein
MIKKGKIILTCLFVAILFLVVGQVNAVSNLSIRVSEPKTPTKNSDFKIVFTVLDLSDSGNPITAKCFYKKNLADAWTQFDTDKAITAGGNTDSCQVNGSIVNTSGQTYYFKATASNGVDSDDTELQGLVAVGYDDRDPSVPTNYKKEKISDCQYKISFKTADDGMTSRVEVYRSESTIMALDGSTRVGDVVVGPNTDGSFTESIPDCNKTYYYVIRAFNVAGNASGPTGDSVTVTTTTAVLGVTEGAIPVTNVTLPAGEGQVLGEKTPEEASPTAKPEVISVKEKGAVKGASDFVSKNKWPLVTLALVLAAIIAYVFFKKKQKKG